MEYSLRKMQCLVVLLIITVYYSGWYGKAAIGFVLLLISKHFKNAMSPCRLHSANSVDNSYVPIFDRQWRNIGEKKN